MGKVKQIFLYIAPFPALVFFKIWASYPRSTGNLLAVSVAMLIYCLLVIVLATRWGKPSYFDWTIAIYFVAITIALAVAPDPISHLLSRYGVTGIYFCLFGAAFIPPLLGFEPFTYHYAKKMAPRDSWENPIFIKINLIMTQVWATLFLFCAVISLYPSVITRALIPIALIVGVGIPFNMRFPDYYLKKLGIPSLKEQRELARKQKTSTRERVMPSRLPATAWEAISNMPIVFNANAAGELSAVITFKVTGDETFDACLLIDKGACAFSQTLPEKADLIIITPANIWLGIARNEKNGQQAFMKQEFTAMGNLGLLMRMSSLFSGATAGSPAGVPDQNGRA